MLRRADAADHYILNPRLKTDHPTVSPLFATPELLIKLGPVFCFVAGLDVRPLAAAEPADAAQELRDEGVAFAQAATAARRQLNPASVGDLPPTRDQPAGTDHHVFVGLPHRRVEPARVADRYRMHGWLDEPKTKEAQDQYAYVVSFYAHKLLKREMPTTA